MALGRDELGAQVEAGRYLTVDTPPRGEPPMRLSPDDLLTQLLALPTGERARLAESLIASLDEDPEVEAAWAVEVERRVAELDAGAVEPVPAEEAFRRARERLQGRS
jgi:putative addiction module component (TIGR02574 family)